jgi:hypothetical protein
MYLQAKRRRVGGRRLGQLIEPPDFVLNSLPSLLPDSEPIWSEQAYAPGAVNADPSVNYNPSPTIMSVGNDLLMVANDPLAQNPVYNASDTTGTGLGNVTAALPVPAWMIAAGAVFAGILVLSFLK